MTNTSEAYALFIAPGGHKAWRDPSTDEPSAMTRTNLPDDEGLARQVKTRILRRLAK